ncbi:unnamed protein product [Cochlearia groenlandica]
MSPSGRITNPDFRQAFQVIDADRDGKISSQDLRLFYAGISRSASSSPSGEIDTDEMISVADANKDGYVEFEEFEKVLETASYCKSNGLMKDVFEVMDRDGDGRLSYGDLKSYLDSAGLSSSDDEIDAMIRLAGGDSNGGVSFEGLLTIFGC